MPSKRKAELIRNNQVDELHAHRIQVLTNEILKKAVAQMLNKSRESREQHQTIVLKHVVRNYLFQKFLYIIYI